MTADAAQGDAPPVDAIAMCRPRPVPVTWSIDIVTVGEGAEKRHMAKLGFLSWNGEHFTYWPLDTLAQLVKHLRGTMRVMSEAETGLATPGGDRSDSGLILPPSAGG